MKNRSTRIAQALNPDSIKIDGRSDRDRLAFVAAYARLIQYYNQKNQLAGNWQGFFMKDQSILLASISKTDYLNYHARFDQLEQGRSQFLLSPTGNPLATGGTVPACSTNCAFIVALDASGARIAIGVESEPVATTGDTSSITWSWPAVTGAASYQLWVGTAGGEESHYFVSSTNSFTQAEAASHGTLGTPSSVNKAEYIIAERLCQLLREMFSRINQWIRFMEQSASRNVLYPYLKKKINETLSGQLSLLVALQQRLGRATHWVVSDADSLFYQNFEPIWFDRPTGQPDLSFTGAGTQTVIRSCLKALRRIYRIVFDVLMQSVEFAGQNYHELESRQTAYPDTALMIAFCRLMKTQQSEINTLAGKHLDFYYEKVLLQGLRPAKPDHTYVCLTLSDKAGSLVLPAGTLFKSGTYPDQSEILFCNEVAAEFNQAAISSVQTLYYEQSSLWVWANIFQNISKVSGFMPAGNASGTGGSVGSSDANYAIIVALDAHGEPVAISGESDPVATTGDTSSITWKWPAYSSAASYQVWVGNTSGGESSYFTSSTNTFIQTEPASSGDAGLPHPVWAGQNTPNMPSFMPTGNASSTGGTVGSSYTHYAIVVAFDAKSTCIAISGESNPVATTGNTSSITWAWPAYPGADKYQIWVGTTSGGESCHFTSSTNTFVQTEPASRGAPGALSDAGFDAGGLLYLNQISDPAQVTRNQQQEIVTWDGFGNDKGQTVDQGFALASPMLFLQGGVRKIIITLSLDNAPQSLCDEDNRCYLSTAKGWFELMPSQITLSSSKNFQITITLAKSDPAIVAFEKGPDGFTSAWPMFKMVLGQSAGLSDPPILKQVAIEVQVEEFSQFSLANDISPLPDTGPQQIFGPVPAVGDRFYIGSNECFSKPLSSLELNMAWDGLPKDFSTYYSEYNDYLATQGHPGFGNYSFKGAWSLLSQKNWHPLGGDASLFPGMFPQPVGTPLGTGGKVPACSTNFAFIVAMDASGARIAINSESKPVPTTGGKSSITWTWPAVTGAASYQVWVGTASGEESHYFTVAINQFKQVKAASKGIAGTPPIFRPAGTVVTGGAMPECPANYAIIVALDANEACIAISSESEPVATTGSGSSITWTWPAYIGAVSYQIWVGTTSSGENNYFSSSTNTFVQAESASNGSPGFLPLVGSYFFENIPYPSSPMAMADLALQPLPSVSQASAGYLSLELTAPEYAFGGSLYAKVVSWVSLKNAETLINQADGIIVKALKRIAAVLIKVLVALKNGIVKTLKGIAAVLIKVLVALKNGIVKTLKGIAAVLIKVLVALKNGIVKALEGIATVLIKVLVALKNGIVKALKGIEEALKKVFGELCILRLWRTIGGIFWRIIKFITLFLNPLLPPSMVASVSKQGSSETLAQPQTFGSILGDIPPHQPKKTAPSGFLPMPNLPYVPKISGLSASYVASSATVISTLPAPADGAAAYPLEIYHYGSFKPYLAYDAASPGEGLGFVNLTPKAIPDNKKPALTLFTGIGGQGCMYVSLGGVNAPCTLTLYAEISADENHIAPENGDIVYYYWSNVGWWPLTVLRDDTGNLNYPGIIKFEISGETPAATVSVQTIEQTRQKLLPPPPYSSSPIMPDNEFWLAIATRKKGVNIKLSYLNVQAVKLTRVSMSSLPLGETPQIEANAISATQNKIPQIASIVQPFASFGGKAAEDVNSYDKSNSFYRRVSMRLNNKDRCVTQADFVEMAHAACANLYYAKVLDGGPGEINIGLVNGYANALLPNAFRPTVGSMDQSRIKKHIASRVSAQTNLHVSNMEFQEVTITASITTVPGSDNKAMQQSLNQKLRVYLSPWIRSDQPQAAIDNNIDRSALINFLNSQKGVVSVKELSIQGDDLPDDDQIIVSAMTHNISLSAGDAND